MWDPGTGGSHKTPLIVNCIIYIDMNMTYNSSFLMKIEHHYNLQTKLTLCIDSIILN